MSKSKKKDPNASVRNPSTAHIDSEDVVFNFKDYTEIDEEYEGECGYCLISELRGTTIGRKLKRIIFTFGVYQCIAGFVLTLIGISGANNPQLQKVYNISKMNSPDLQTLTLLTGIFTFLWGIGSMCIFKLWGAFCTSRLLLITIMKIYMFIDMICLIFSLWTVIILFACFEGVDFRLEKQQENYVLSSFVFSVIFLFPYIVLLIYYPLEISYFSDELHYEGVQIEEPNPPDFDFSDFNILETLYNIMMIPVALVLELYNFIKGGRRAFAEYLANRRLAAAEKRAQEDKFKNKKKSGFCTRLFKTFYRCFHFLIWPCRAYISHVTPEETGEERMRKEKEAEAELKEKQKNRDDEEMIERERDKLERQRQEQREKLEWEKNAAIEAERKRVEQEKLEEDNKVIEEIKKQEEEEALALPTLNIQQYKALWSSLGTAGAFQCKLKIQPVLTNFTDHIRKQGFYVVFAGMSNGSDLEVGICNIRKDGIGNWFMARFLCTPGNFSAVMKAQNPDDVTGFVKKFALAKCLKIDSSK